MNKMLQTVGYKRMNNNIYVLSDKKVKNANSLPMFEIEYIKQKIDLEKYDALLFTSKNAIKALSSMDESWKKIPAYVIAPETAKVLEHHGGNLAFVGEKSHGNDFAKEVEDKLAGKKVLYFCGKKVVSNVVDILNENNVQCDRLVVYETVCKSYENATALPKGSVIVFSSPSTINCFFKNISWDESYKAVSIGKTTAKYFPSHITPIVANHTTLNSCVEKAFELLNT